MIRLLCGYAFALLVLLTGALGIAQSAQASDLIGLSADSEFLVQGEKSLVSNSLTAELSNDIRNEEAADVATIAEPGTLGLLALAGLMGGAMAMRRRLG